MELSHIAALLQPFLVPSSIGEQVAVQSVQNSEGAPFKLRVDGGVPAQLQVPRPFRALCERVGDEMVAGPPTQNSEAAPSKACPERNSNGLSLGEDVPRVPHPFRVLCERVGDEHQQAAVLNPAQLQSISTYINILLRWNSRINLTAVRAPEAIVTRHFGESLFLARHLFPQPASLAAVKVVDVGSGAGFPGLPIKIWAQNIELTLIEANHKKAIFLREIVRAITLTNINVFAGRAETYSAQADVVTLRAVERFEDALPAAARIVAPKGRLALSIGTSQISRAHELTIGLRWRDPLPIPNSSHRMLLVGTRETL